MKNFTIIVVTLGCIVGSIFSLGGRDIMKTADLKPIKVVGIIGVYGNEPHTWLGFIDQQGTEYILKATSQVLEDLRKLQGVLLEISGTIDARQDNELARLRGFSGGTIQVEKFSPYTGHP